MTALRLTQRSATAQRLDLGTLVPETLSNLTVKAIGALPLRLGNEQVTLGDVFQIEGTPGDELIIEPCADNLDRIGANMTSGRIRVMGNAGHGIGAGMCDGRIEVIGDAGDSAAEGMRGGQLSIAGDCGDRLGAPHIGERQGISGGLVHVRGNAGARAGERQRRGILLIEGECGDYAGCHMIAGTLVALGGAGMSCGQNMRRGTLLLGHTPQSLPVTFADNGRQQPGFLSLLLRDLETLIPRPLFPSSPWVQRFLGDLACGGLGEILVIS